MRQNLVRNQLQGITQSFDDSERLAAELSYANGLLHGASKFYSQGALSRQAHYLNGMLDGLVEDYSEDGRPLSRSEYSKDQLHGERCLFWPNGKVLQRETYERGIRQGEIEKFDESGQPLKNKPKSVSMGDRLASALRGD
jgi:antitoxin component YwqK of YwqJK toxin-antitoxin module